MQVKILAVGPGRWRDEVFHPTVVKPGQIAIIGEYTDLEIGQQVICQEADIRCIVEEDRPKLTHDVLAEPIRRVVDEYRHQ